MIVYVIMLTSSGGGLSAELRRRVLASCKHNIKIIAVDNKDSESAKIFCDVFSKVPLGIDEKYNKKIEELVLKYNIDMVIPCSDEEALSLSKDRRSIEKHNCILACVHIYVSLSLIYHIIRALNISLKLTFELCILKLS